jgi:hypothetical protein
VASDGAQEKVVAALLERHGRTFADELGLDPGTPSGLFGLLVFAMLSSTRIRFTLALAGTAALLESGWTSAATMRDAGWEARTRVLNRSGYARYDERTSSMLGDAARTLIDAYRGDLRELRKAAGCDPAREKELLQEIKGIGPVGADIFLREAQAAWPELPPYLDKRALDAAAALGLPRDPTALAALAGAGGDAAVARLVAALVRCRLEGDAAEIAERA